MLQTVRLLGFVLVVCTLHGLAGCAGMAASWKAPEVELVGLQPKRIGVDRQSFLLHLRVKNPNDRALPVRGLSYRVLVQGHALAEGSSELARLIPPGGTEEVDVAVRSNLLDLLPELPHLLLNKDPLDWTVSGTAFAEVNGLSIPLPYRYSGQIELSAWTGSLLQHLRVGDSVAASTRASGRESSRR
ncbi:MAG: LEA type 2 family protein [Thiocapsa sp.]|jgi:LEA14-like dessication related protein|nr:LEA type 2 family protein [Thiocapsa sp.]MCG6897884.1 LEA type 2 family protein [Thiocapsa sp.]MCG6984962.1 LEA type 2 family protein [Thiocapsa sp.]